jgi:hypothetical protein
MSSVVRGTPWSTLAYPPTRMYRTRARFIARKIAGTVVTDGFPPEGVRFERDLQPLSRREPGKPTKELRIVGHGAAPDGIGRPP